jgi:hypothetical protein
MDKGGCIQPGETPPVSQTDDPTAPAPVPTWIPVRLLKSPSGWYNLVGKQIRLTKGGAVKTETLRIVDHGRGPQLSSCRITVQDLLPYYREGASNAEIRRWISSLSDDEIALLRDYIRDHLEEVLEAEKEIKAYHDRMRAQQPAWTHANEALSLNERHALLQKKLAQRKAGTNGAQSTSG